MPIILHLEDHDEIFREVCKHHTPIFINDLPNSTEEDKERIRMLTINQLNSDTVSIIPRCGCGATKGRYVLGKQCPVCQDTVRSNIDESVRSILWFRKPEPVHKLINPVFMQMLAGYFTKNNWNAIQYLTDTTYSVGNRMPVEIEKLQQAGLERDFNEFTLNFDNQLDVLMHTFKPKANKPYNELIDWIDDNRKKVFSDKQPILNKALFVTDQTNVGIYMENSVVQALDAINHVISIDKDYQDRNPRVIVNRTARMQARQAAFYDSYTGTNMQPKPGHARRHVYGARNIFTARGVISSVTGDHKYDEVEIPWGIAVPMFQHHLMSKLMRYGFNYNNALGYVYRHVRVYDELIHKFLDEIFAEFPGGRGPVMILHRNPTLLQMAEASLSEMVE